MADGITVTQIRGLEDLLRRLDQVPLVLSRTVAREGLEEAGSIIQAAAEASAPRRSGELQDDIVVEVHVSSDLRSSRVKVGPGYNPSTLRTRVRGKYAGRQDSTTSPGVYGKFVESGHGMPGHSWRSRFGSARERRRTGRQIELGTHDVPPHPWLAPSFASSQEAGIDVLINRTRDELNRIDQLVR